MNATKETSKIMEVKLMCQCGGEYERAMDIVFENWKREYLHKCKKCWWVTLDRMFYPYNKIDMSE
jgi:hypothetical protein